jgi:hypothetical protein
MPASNATAAWPMRYARYLEESTARAARTAELNTRLLKRIANGELAPATLDRQYTAFLATNVGSYTDDVAETGMQFLTGLIRAGTTYSHELAERIAPGEFETSPSAPPSFERGDWNSAFQHLTDYATAENAAVAELLRALMEKVASGAVSPDDIDTTSAGFHGEQLPQTVDELVSLFFELMTHLDEAHSDFTTRYLEGVLELSGEAEVGEISLHLVGASGEIASARLAVANNEPEPATLRAVMTDVRRTDGVGPAFEPDITIRPSRFTLAPGAEEALTITVRLAADAFEPGGPEYSGTLHVLSPGRTVLAVPVTIRAAVPVDQPDA